MKKLLICFLMTVAPCWLYAVTSINYIDLTNPTNVYYGDGSNLTGVIASSTIAVDSSKLPLTGGTLSGLLTGTTIVANNSLGIQDSTPEGLLSFGTSLYGSGDFSKRIHFYKDNGSNVEIGFSYGAYDGVNTAFRQYVNGTGAGSNKLSFGYADNTSGVFNERMNISETGVVTISTSLVVGRATPYAGNNSGISVGRERSVQADADNYGQCYLFSISTAGIDRGGVLSFGGDYDSSPGDTRFASIAGTKENDTLGDYAGELSFWTRANGGGQSKRLKIASDGTITAGGSIYAGALNIGYDVAGRFNEIGVSTGNIQSELTAAANGVADLRISTGSIQTQVTNNASAISDLRVSTGSLDAAKLNLSGGTMTGLLTGTTIVLNNSLGIQDADNVEGILSFGTALYGTNDYSKRINLYKQDGSNVESGISLGAYNGTNTGLRLYVNGTGSGLNKVQIGYSHNDTAVFNEILAVKETGDVTASSSLLAPYLNATSSASVLGDFRCTGAGTFNTISAGALAFTGTAAGGFNLYEAQAGGNNFVRLSVPDALSTDTTYYFPADGTSGQVLGTNGAGTLSWASDYQGVKAGTATVALTLATNATIGAVKMSSNTFVLRGGCVIPDATSPMVVDVVYNPQRAIVFESFDVRIDTFAGGSPTVTIKLEKVGLNGLDASDFSWNNYTGNAGVQFSTNAFVGSGAIALNDVIRLRVVTSTEITANDYVQCHWTYREQ